MTEQDILTLIDADPAMRRVLDAVAALGLPDWRVAAGFVRSKVWDTLHGYAHANAPTDIDVVYYDDAGTFDERAIERQLAAAVPCVEWEATNQATVHEYNGAAKYASSADAISRWPETATAVGVIVRDGRLALVAPHGIADLVAMIVRPTPWFAADPARLARVRERVTQKRWLEKWPKLRVEEVQP